MRIAHHDAPVLADTDPRQPPNFPSSWIHTVASGTVTEEWGFGSAHSGGMSAVFGDGSVKPISLNIDNTVHSDGTEGVLWRITVRYDGLSVDPNSY